MKVPWSKWSKTVKAAAITGICVIIAAIVTGIFVILANNHSTPTLIPPTVTQTQINTTATVQDQATATVQAQANATASAQTNATATATAILGGNCPAFSDVALAIGVNASLVSNLTTYNGPSFLVHPHLSCKGIATLIRK